MIPAMILCAGFGTRLRPLTDHFPKPLLPIGDRPALFHILDQLRSKHFTPLVINTHHRAQDFSRFLPHDVAVSHEPSILGTAGGVAHAASLLGAGEVLLWNGDIHVQPDLERLVRFHRMHDASHAVVATLLAERCPFGEGTIGVDPEGMIARLRGESFNTESFGANYLGLMVLAEPTRCGLPQEGCLVGDALIPLLRSGKKASVVLHEGPWVDIGTPRQFFEANFLWLRKHSLSSWCSPHARVPPGIELLNSVVLEGATLEGEGTVDRCIVMPGGVLHSPARGILAIPGESLQILEGGFEE